MRLSKPEPGASVHHDHVGLEESLFARPRLYDWGLQILTLGQIRSAYQGLAKASGVGLGDAALDVGCGTGLLTRELAKRVGETGSATGADPIPQMLQRAQSLGAPPRAAKIAYALLPAEDLSGIADNSFDVVTCCLAVHHIEAPARQRAMDEMFRVTRSGGHVFIAEFEAPPNKLSQAVLAPFVRSHMLGDPAAELSEMLTRTGFAQLETRRQAWVFRCVRGRKPTD